MIVCLQFLQTSNPTLETFQELLDKQPDTFYPTRTSKALHTHWLLMKQYHLLPDQSVQPMPRGDHVLNFSDAEDLLTDEDLKVCYLAVYISPRDENHQVVLNVFLDSNCFALLFLSCRNVKGIWLSICPSVSLSVFTCLFKIPRPFKVHIFTLN